MTCIGVVSEEWEDEPDFAPRQLRYLSLQVELADHVKTKVNQYAILHTASMSLSGSHMPRGVPSSSMAFDARSIGTSRMILDGKAKARNTGISK